MGYEAAKGYEAVVGMEVHAQLLTRSKMFCGCSAQAFGAPPNRHVCPTCLGLPGALPVANRRAVEQTILVGLASCFYGYPLFRFFLILAGLIYGYLLGQSFTPAAQPWMAFLIGAGAAVVLALLAYSLWSIGVIISGGVLGFMILTALGLALNLSQGAVILMGGLGAAVVGLLCFGFRDLFVMLATAFSGATQAVYGLGLLMPALAFGGGRANLLAVVAIIALGGVGFATQYGMFKDRRTYSR